MQFYLHVHTTLILHSHRDKSVNEIDISHNGQVYAYYNPCNQVSFSMQLTRSADRAYVHPLLFREFS